MPLGLGTTAITGGDAGATAGVTGNAAVSGGAVMTEVAGAAGTSCVLTCDGDVMGPLEGGPVITSVGRPT